MITGTINLYFIVIGKNYSNCKNAYPVCFLGNVNSFTSRTTSTVAVISQRHLLRLGFGKTENNQIIFIIMENRRINIHTHRRKIQIKYKSCIFDLASCISSCTKLKSCACVRLHGHKQNNAHRLDTISTRRSTENLNPSNRIEIIQPCRCNLLFNNYRNKFTDGYTLWFSFFTTISSVSGHCERLHLPPTFCHPQPVSSDLTNSRSASVKNIFFILLRK